MKNLFDPVVATEVRTRIHHLTPDSPRQWGTMTLSQTLAHCSAGLETACGDRIAPRMALGRLMGRFIKPLALGNDTAMRRNSPTSPDLIVSGTRDFLAERDRLAALLERFTSAGPTGCTSHPHSFFGRLTPDEWAELAYKHLDHHLRQFNA